MRRVQGGRAGRERRLDADDGFPHLPGNRDLAIGQRFDRRGVADQREHRLATEAHETVGEHRLILDIGIDAETVGARDISSREDFHETGIFGVQRGKIADGEVALACGERTARSHSASAGAASAP